MPAIVENTAPVAAEPTHLPQQSGRVREALNRWSGSFFKLTVPSQLGTKAQIVEVTDEGAKVLSVGQYFGRRTAEVTAIPYDGSRYNGHEIEDEASGSLWAYESRLPAEFTSVEGEKFIISLGHIFKCHTCRGQGRVRCSTCGGKVRWRSTNWKDEVVENVCSCGDGKENCSTCRGFGEMLKVLAVSTRFIFDEKRAREYTGRLPETLLMSSAGRIVFQHVVEFDQRVTVEAMDGFDAHEYDRLMAASHSELKQAAQQQVDDNLVDPSKLYLLIDQYFQSLPNPVAASRRLEDEVLPVRLRAQVVDVPLQAVKYGYKGKIYSAYIYGNDARVWPDGEQPKEFTWKLATLIGFIALVVVGIVVSLATA